MPEMSKKIDGKKYMWDGKTYDSEMEAKDAESIYKKNNFETELLKDDDRYLVYTRRVVTDVVVEGASPL